MMGKETKEGQIEYLEWVIKIHGEKQHIMNTNCNGNPVKKGDYVFDHGTAEELLNRIKAGGDLISWC